MIKEIGDLEIIPKFYGLYRFDINKRKFLICPIPFNIIFKFFYLVWTVLKRGFDFKEMDFYKTGFRDGHNIAIQKIKKDLYNFAKNDEQNKNMVLDFFKTIHY